MSFTLGTRLKEIRIKKKLNQEQIAQIIGVNKSTISGYESGARQPSYDILVSFARLYHVSTDYLLGLENERYISVSGLTEQEIQIIGNLISSMTEKNNLLTAIENKQQYH